MKKNRAPMPWKALAGIIAVIVGLFSAACGIRQLLDLEYFKVKQVLSREANIPELKLLLGRGIFSVDLVKESALFSGRYPNYQKVRLTRILPNRIFVDFIKRKPVAYIKTARYIFVDDAMVLFDIKPPFDNRGLALITGLESKLAQVKLGQKSSAPELMLAVLLIKEINRSKIARYYSLQKVDVGNMPNASVFLLSIDQPPVSPGKNKKPAVFQLLQVKIGNENLRQRVSLFSSVLAQARKDWYNIKYIDVRFKEPVINFYDTKK